MKSLWLVSAALLVGLAAGESLASPLATSSAAPSSASVLLVGSASPSTGTARSSISSPHGSGFAETRDYEAGRSMRGSTRAERYAPAPDRHRRPRAVYLHFQDED